MLYSISDFESQRKLRLFGLTDEDFRSNKDELLVLLAETSKVEFEKLVAIFKRGNYDPFVVFCFSETYCINFFLL